MKRFLLLNVVLYCAVISLSAAVTVELPYKDVSVSRSGRTAVFTGTELYGSPGQPHLPVYTCGILLPPDADLKTVSFSMSGLKEEIVGKFTVKPALPPMSIHGEHWPENRTIVDGKDIGVYSHNAVYPDKHVDVASIGRLNCFKVVAVKINLARYNPVTQELLRMKAGKLVLDWKSESNYSRSHNRLLKIPSSNKKRVKKYVVNYNEFITDYEADFTFIRESKLAIITTSAIQSGSDKLDDFIASKAVRKIETQVVTESEWGGSATSLRSWLQENYQTSGIEYILLIGHYQDDVPMMDFPGYSGSSSCPSDWPYAQLDGDFKSDKTCEVHYGRIPVYSNNYGELDAILEKTIAYESANSQDALWRKNTLLLGPGYNSGSNMACVPLNAVHDDFVETTPGWSSYRMYGDRWGSPTGDFDEAVGSGSSAITKIVAKWAEGQFGVIDWATHGSTSSAQDIIASGNTSTIGNQYPGFVFCGSCSNAKPSSSTNLSWSLLKNCAIGAIGGTDLTYYGGDYETSGSDNAWAYHFGRTMIGDSMTYGEALTALREMAPSSFGWSNRAPYVLYGDPTIGVNTYRKSPYISIIVPGSGEEYIAGSSVTITWSSNIEKPVSLYLLKGTNVVETLAKDVANNGEHPWDIPEDTEAGSDYKIRMTGDTVTAEGDVFTIKKKPSIVLGTNTITVNLQQADSVEKKLKVSNEGEGELRYSVACRGGSASLLINEVYVPYSDFADGFEIWNRGTECDLKGYKIEWKDDANSSGSHTFEDSYIVKEGETFAVADEQVTGKCITIENVSWGNTGNDITELSIVIYDPDGNCVDYVKTAGSNDTPPPGQWDGAGLQTGSERFYRNKNEDGNSASDWSFADGEESINEINPGQTMDGVGQYRLKYSPEEGTVDAVSEININVTFNSKGLVNGDYYDTLEIIHDDPDNQSPLLIYCKLIVGPTSIGDNAHNAISKVNISCSGNRIYYQIPDRWNNKKVSIKLYNVQGKLVRTLLNGPAAAGRYFVRLDRQGGMHKPAAGLYLCRMETKGFTKTVNVLLSR